MLFVVENNGIAQTTRTADTIGGSIVARGAAFGLHTWHVDDSRPGDVRAGRGVVRTVRSLADSRVSSSSTRCAWAPTARATIFATTAEMASIRARDPLARLGVSLAPAVREAIERRNAEFIGSVRDARSGRERSHGSSCRPRTCSITVPRLAPARTRRRICALRERAVGAQRLAPPAAGGSSGGRPPRRGSARSRTAARSRSRPGCRRIFAAA